MKKILKTLIKLKNVISMGRERKDALDLVLGLQETIEEHLWKLFAYSEFRQNDVSGWLRSLNKHITRLDKFRIPKSGGKTNFGYDELYQRYYDEPFGTDADIRSLIKSWNREGYPFVEVTTSDKNKLKQLAIKYINCILNNEKFAITEDELNTKQS